MVSWRRILGAIVLGFFYGGSIYNGVDRGIDYLTRGQYRLYDLPAFDMSAMALSSVLGGALAAYCGRRVWVGVLSMLPIAALRALLGALGSDHMIYGTAITIAAGVAGAIFGARGEPWPSDLEMGTFLGVRWGHWLWLWLPFQFSVANAVWLAYPASSQFVREILTAPVILVIFAYTLAKALDALAVAHEAPRWQRALRFLGWWLLAPVGLNLLHLWWSRS
jgi:hypothetical protein